MKDASTTSTTNGTSRRPSTGAADGDDANQRWFDESVCVFWLGSSCLGLAASLVGEVFNVEAYAPVPSALPAVLGLFNLRGTPVALIDLAMVLELSGAGVSSETLRGTATALVIRTGSLTVGALIRKMEVVVLAGRGLYTPPGDAAGEHPVVAGFLELPDRPELTITLLDPDELVARLDRLKYRDSKDDELE